MKRIFITLTLFTLSLPLMAAEVYKVVRPDGTVEFTDEPASGGKPMRVDKLPSYAPPAVPKQTTPAASSGGSSPQLEVEKKKRDISYKHFTFSAPIHESTVFHDSRGLNVVMSVIPALGDGDQIELTLDGKVVATQPSTTFLIPEVYRGSHTLSARLINNQGRSVKRAEPITFYLRQHTKR